jgi:DNA-binding NarL/FixJ family response regulator
VLVVSSSDEPKLINMALDRGAAGFVPKNSAPHLMLQAISLVLSGGIYIPPAVLKLLQYSRNDNGSVADTVPAANLTERHREVLEHLAKGYSNKQIARALGVSEGTVKAHVAGLFRLLQAQNRTQAILLATERGLVRPH